MKLTIDIPKDFTGDYIADKFKDFFSRVIADIDCKGLCGNYEKEIAEMFLKAFDKAIVEKENIKFVYTENGKEKSSLDEYRRRCEIMEHNQKLQKEYPVYMESKDEEITNEL